MAPLDDFVECGVLESVVRMAGIDEGCGDAFVIEEGLWNQCVEDIMDDGLCTAARKGVVELQPMHRPRWTTDDDRKLALLRETVGANWGKISNVFGKKFRAGVYKTRYLMYAQSSLNKAPCTAEERAIILARGESEKERPDRWAFIATTYLKNRSAAWAQTVYNLAKDTHSTTYLSA
jgi:hypothetical protein